MTKARKKPSDIDDRIQFYQAIDANEYTLAQALKKMRKIVGMTQEEYAKLVGVAPRIIKDIERGVANPTKKTLEKIARPFQLQIIFGRVKS